MAAVAAVLLLSVVAAPVRADILEFGGQPGAITATATTGGNSASTTIDATNTGVLISSIGGAGANITAFLNLTASSSGDATNNSGNITQNFSGNFSITSGANDTGINYLSGSFSGLTFGFSGGTVATLTASDPPGTILFSSSYSPSFPLSSPTGASFTFSGVSPALGIVQSSNRMHSTIGSFGATGSGTFSATASTPEPSTMAIAGLGALGMIGYSLRRRKSVGA
jgi:hypothetical protein